MRTRYKVHSKGPEYPYFVTSTTVAWIPIFTHKDHFDIVGNSLTFCRTKLGLKLYAYVIMENHIHLVAAGHDLSKTMQSFKSFTAKQVIESISQKQMDWLLNQLAYHKAKHKKQSDYQVWQEGIHPQEILSADMLIQKIEYIHYNPVRRGYVERPEHWKYSSAGCLLTGDRGAVELDPLPFV